MPVCPNVLSPTSFLMRSDSLNPPVNCEKHVNAGPVQASGVMTCKKQ